MKTIRHLFADFITAPLVFLVALILWQPRDIELPANLEDYHA